MVYTSYPHGVILLSGNVHFGEVSALEILGYPLLEITSSGLTHTDNRYAKMRNTLRVAGPVVEPNFGMVEVDWETAEGPQVTISLNGVAGRRQFSYSFALADIQ